MKAAGIALGILFVIVAIIYFALPAGALPKFFPGYVAGSTHVHLKHGIVALVIGIILFGGGWFAGRTR
jgi:hypothetical protein